MSNIDYFRALQILALNAVENQDGDSFYRKVARWYSREFATPLAEVDLIPETTLFQTFYEDTFDSMYHGDEEQKKQYEIYRADIISGKANSQDEEDEKWAQEEIAKLKAAERPKKDISQIIDNTAKHVSDMVNKAKLDRQKGPSVDPNISKEGEINLDGIRLLGEDPSIPSN
jgi:hypothetical protein